MVKYEARDSKFETITKSQAQMTERSCATLKYCGLRQYEPSNGTSHVM